MGPIVSLVAIALLASQPPLPVQHVARSADGNTTVEWLGQGTGCSAMRFTSEKKVLPSARFVDSCSELRTPFSPDGQWVLFLVGPTGPLHVVPRTGLAGYLDGDLPEAVVYPSENAGMPPAPPRTLTFLRWSGPDSFELTGAAHGGVHRYAYRIEGKRALNTCYLDGYRRQCAFPSPGGAHTVMVPFQGFLVVAQAEVGGVLSAQDAVGLRFPSTAFPLVRPVFLRWLSSDQLLLQADGADGQPVEHTFMLSTRTLSPPRPVTVEWSGWPAP